MILKEWHLGLSLNKIDLQLSALWVQILDLPLEMMTWSNVEKIGKEMGRLLEIDPITTSTITVKKFMSIRVEIDTTKLLIDGFLMSRVRRIWAKIALKYEHLSEFCYMCGCLGHVQQSCPIYMKNIIELPYGQDMRVEGQDFSM